MATDAGSARRDAAPPADDAGSAVQDAGSSTSDAGSTPYDAAGVAQESGSPPHDAGGTSFDASGDDICADFGWYGDLVCDTFCPQPDPDCDDACVENGWYGDLVCDTFCPQPDPDCDDACVENGWYGDGFCDTGCSQPDPDCEATQPGDCPEHSYPDGEYCYCEPGYVPDALGLSCVPDDGSATECPPHAHPVGEDCYCDEGYVVDALGTSCVPDGGSTPAGATLGTPRAVFTIDHGSIGGIAAAGDQIYALQNDQTDMYGYPQLWVHRIDAPSAMAWDLSGLLEADGDGGIDVFAGYVYVADSDTSPHDGKILRLPIEPPTGAPSVVTLKYGLTGPRNIRFHDGWVYYTQAGFDSVWRTRAAYATNEDEVAGGSARSGVVSRLDIQGDQMAVLAYSSIVIGTIGDTASFAAVASSSGARDFDWDGDELFLVSLTVYDAYDVRGTLTRYTLSADHAEVLAGDIDDMEHVRVGGSYAYFGGADGLFRVPRVGGAVEVVSGACAPRDLEVTARGVAFACAASVWWVPFLDG